MAIHTLPRSISILPTLAIIGGGLFLSSVAHAANYEVCVDIRVQNTDSDVISPTGITEDYYLTQTVQTFPARGIQVEVITGNQTLIKGYTDASTGCIQFMDSSISGSNYVTDINVSSIARLGSTVIRAHDAGSTATSRTPGELFVTSFVNTLVSPNVTRRVTIPLMQNWNAFETASYALWRVRTGLDGKVISMGFDSAGSSSIFPGATDWIEENAHLIRIKDTSRQLKFEVAHELGHAAARLNYGQNGAENSFSAAFVYPGTDAQDCDNDSSYDLRSAEWNGLGFKEGYANLYSARVFNDRDDDGTFRMLGRTISLERFQAAGLGNPSGGHIQNHCYSNLTVPNGVSTTEDWTRFLWDIYTIPVENCGAQLGLDEMYDIYSATRSIGPTPNNDWHTDIMTAIAGLGNLSACEKAQAESFANWNGIGGPAQNY